MSIGVPANGESGFKEMLDTNSGTMWKANRFSPEWLFNMSNDYLTKP
jgi:hypothetical protein